jgi:serine protease Do
MSHRSILISVFCVCVFAGSMPARADLVQTLAKLKPAIVGVGTVLPTRNPARMFAGTGFVVGDGLTVVTNVHVLPALLDEEKKEQLVVYAGSAQHPDVRDATVVARDAEHDIALLRISGKPLASLSMGDSNTLKEGATVAFTGFPLGMILGLYPATHRGIVAAITPYVSPVYNSKQLDVKAILRLNHPFDVFQLDAIAYPGNSGSPMYDPDTGVVYGVVNSVFIKESKENLLKQPSGITYVIPGNYIRDLLAHSRTR